MRRVILIASLLLVAECLMAQNPKAVFKSILDGDIAKSVEKLEKINDKTREKYPQMCLLAEAALLSMPGQSGDKQISGYELLVANIEAIRSDEDADKVFKGLDISLEDVISSIEQESMKYVCSVDDEATYVKYLELAARGNHTNMREVEQRLELRRYKSAVESESIELCTSFLEMYPRSQYRTSVIKHRTDLYFNIAIGSSSESVMEEFIATYPNYDKVDKVSARLMSMRYNRIFASRDLDDMKWFVEQYPNHTKMAQIKQRMADLEFPTLKHTCESLEKFIAYYPDVTQIAEATRLLQVAKASEQGSVKHFMEYMRIYGYDINYSAMVRGIYANTNRFIITPDIDNVTLLHFANEEGLAGYMDFEGNVVIEPKYSAERVSSATGLYNTFMLSEFTHNRSVAIVKLEDKWGAINGSGEVVVPHQYDMVTLIDNQICAVAITSKEYYDDDMGDAVGYYSDIYDLKGNLLKKNTLTYFWLGFQQEYREFEKSNGEIVGSYLTPKYGIFYDDDGAKILIDRDGKKRYISWNGDEGVTDNIVVVELEVNGSKRRYFADIDANATIKSCPYQRVYPMSCGLAMVYDGNGYGFIDKNLELVIPCKFNVGQLATRFNCGVMLTEDGVINTKGEYVSLGEGTIMDIHNGGGLSYNLPGLFVVSNDKTHSVVDAMGTVLVQIEDEFAPTVEGNYVIDSKGKRHLFTVK